VPGYTARGLADELVEEASGDVRSQGNEPAA